MTIQQILSSSQTKTSKMRQLFELGKSRREVADLLGVGYGFVQNVYAKTYPDRIGTRRRILATAYRAKSFNRKFGVEIECFGVSRAALKAEINRLGVNCVIEGYNHSTRRHWKIVSDSSIDNTRGQACEVVSPILRGQSGLQQLQIVCQALKNCRALINKSCGLHIHFDAENLSLQTWKNLYKNYINYESTIDSMMPRSRRGNTNYYTKSLLDKVNTKEKAFSKINAANSIKKISKVIADRKRYYKINAESYFRHKSIEFRQHSGTIEYTKIENWILFLHRMVDFSEQGFVSQQSSFDSMSKFLADEQHNFYHNRIQDLAA